MESEPPLPPKEAQLERIETTQYDVLQRIEYLAEQERTIKQELASVVDEARQIKMTWEKIADAADLTKSAAHSSWSDKGREYNRLASARKRRAPISKLSTESVVQPPTVISDDPDATP
jgi:hypothetical protein